MKIHELHHLFHKTIEEIGRVERDVRDNDLPLTAAEIGRIKHNLEHIMTKYGNLFQAATTYISNLQTQLSTTQANALDSDDLAAFQALENVPGVAAILNPPAPVVTPPTPPADATPPATPAV